jgi:hypothetical protein
MSIKALVLAIWAAIHPSAPKLPDAPEIATAIEVVITEDNLPPVFGSREDDAAVMAYYALRESSLRKHAVGDGGRSFGVWQENEKTGRADVLTQARAWLYMLHEGARICPDNPAAPLSGGCTAASRIAARRVAKARELLAAAKRALAAANANETAPRTRSAFFVPVSRTRGRDGRDAGGVTRLASVPVRRAPTGWYATVA